MNKREEAAFVVMQNTLLDVLDNLPKQLIKERVQRALIMSAIIIEPATKVNSGKPGPR